MIQKQSTGDIIYIITVLILPLIFIYGLTVLILSNVELIDYHNLMIVLSCIMTIIIGVGLFFQLHKFTKGITE